MTFQKLNLYKSKLNDTEIAMTYLDDFYKLKVLVLWFVFNNLAH